MPDKAIQFPFNYVDFIESRKTLWAYSFKKTAKSYIVYTILPIIILAIRFWVNNGDPFSLIVGFGLLAYIILKWLELNKSRKKFLQQSEQYAKRFQKESSNINYVLSDDTIEYGDDEKSYKVKWDLFKTYAIFRESIILINKDNNNAGFIMTKKSIGDDNFNQVCQILNEQIGKRITA